jgi:hypothetical protein
LTRKAARALINIEFFVVLKLDRVNKKSFLLNKKQKMKKPLIIVWNCIGLKGRTSIISMEVCRPGEGPVNIREGTLLFDNAHKLRVSISNKVGFFYKKHPPPHHE